MAAKKGNAELSIELNAVDNVSATTQQVEKRVSRFERAFSATGKGIGAVLTGTTAHFTAFSVAAAASMTVLKDTVINPLKSMLSEFSQGGFQLERLAHTARLGVATLGALGFAAEQTGSSTNAVASAMAGLQGKMESASRGSLSAIQDLYKGCGLLYEDLKKLSPEEQFLRVADVIKNVGNEADKAEIVRRVFGSDELLPLLRQGSDAIRQMMAEGEKLGAPWSKENIRNSQLLAQSFNRIKTIVGGIKTSFLSLMTDSITGFLEKGQAALSMIQKWVTEHPVLVKTFAGLAASMVGVFTAGAVLIPVFMGLKVVIGSFVGIFAAFLSPWVAIPVLIGGSVVAFLHFSGTLGTVTGKVAGFLRESFDVLRWFFGDSIALIASGDFSAAWENMWAKIQIIFIQSKRAISDAIDGLWQYILQSMAQAFDVATEYLDGLFFNGNEVFGNLWKSVKQCFSGMLEDVGASSGSIVEVFLVSWFSIKKGFLEVWFGIKKAFYAILGSIQQYWISFRKEFQAGINWMYGKLNGLTDEQIARMTLTTDAEFDKKANDAAQERQKVLAQTNQDKNAAITGARADIQARIQAQREKPQKENAKITALTKKIEESRTFIQKSMDPTNPESPAYQSGTAGGPAVFLQEQLKDASHGTQNSFQAMFGFGQTTEQKQLDVSRQILQLFQTLMGNAGV